MTRRLLKWAAVTILILLAIPIMAVVVVLVVANVEPGRLLIETETASLTDGMVRIEGLAGRFPDALKVGQIQVSDTKGPYVTISNLTLDWSPLRLLQRVAQIDLLQADRVDLTRLPEAEHKSKSSSGRSFSLPVAVDVRRLHVDQVIIDAPVAGVPAMLAANGSADLTTLTEGTARLEVQRLDKPGHYTISANLTRNSVEASVNADEPAKGLIASAAHLPDLGATSIQASINGPRDALGTQVEITAGPLTASVSGTVDLEHDAADLAVKARAPAMAPAAGVSWQSVLVNATVHGPFTKPDANGTLRINSLSAEGARIGALAADVTGNAGAVKLHVTIADLHIPAPKPDIFSAEPVILDASVKLDEPNRPVTFALRHPLIELDGTAKTEGIEQVQAHLVLPDLSPLAAGAGADVQGSTHLDIRAERQADTSTAAVTGRIAVTGGMAPVPALIGDDGTVDLAASMHGEDIMLSRLAMNGKALGVSVHGSMSNRNISADWSVALADLTAVQPSLSGHLDVKGHADGKLDDLAVQADVGADLAAKGYSSGHITANVDATGLPDTPHATVSAEGTLLDAPLSLALTADRSGNTYKVAINQASWKSVRAGGTASLIPPAVLPTGSLQLDVGRLGDLEPLLGRPIAGQANATLDSNDKAAKLSVTVRDVALPGTAAVSKMLLDATVTDPTGHPTIDGTFTANGVSVSNARSVSARATARGPIDSVAVSVATDAPDLAGSPAKITTAGTLDAIGKTFALARMEASWKQQVLRLLAPAKFNFSEGVAVDHLRLGFRQAELSVSGSVNNRLDLTANLRNLPADIGAIINPAFAADGVIAMNARLTGTTARPEGTVRLTANGVRQRQGPGRALPAANLTATLSLRGTSAEINTKLIAGPSYVSVTGSAPMRRGGAMDLKTDGRVDLAMLDPILTADGRRARGEVNLNAIVTGSTAAPRITGTARLSNGSVTDYTLGANVTDITATVQATGDTIRLSQFRGNAGPGTLGGSGSISLAGAMPVDLHLTANHARPVTSDLMTVLIDANLTLQGDLEGDLLASGTLNIRHADIQIPDTLPSSVAVLPVRDINSPPPPPPKAEPQSKVSLNLTLQAPQQIFINGRGLNAELGGTIHLHGTLRKPIPDGGFELRQGTLNIVGSTLNFTEGTVTFSGAGLTDPSIHFVATSTTATMVATLTVSGTASHPKITVSSVPEMPQDEILSQLLFGTSTSKLNPLQLAEIAAALAQLSGATAGINPLNSLRTALGLDQLSVGSNSAGSPSLQAGRYLTRGVYLGAQQSATGNGTQATVQVDLAKGLKLQATAGTAAATATGSTSNADAASVGIAYQFQY